MIQFLFFVLQVFKPSYLIVKHRSISVILTKYLSRVQLLRAFDGSSERSTSCHRYKRPDVAVVYICIIPCHVLCIYLGTLPKPYDNVVNGVYLSRIGVLLELLVSVLKPHIDVIATSKDEITFDGVVVKLIRIPPFF